MTTVGYNLGFSRRCTVLSALRLGIVLLIATISAQVIAFPHIVKEGETLASLASRYYGRIQLERVLATANSLDGNKTHGLAAGMVLEIPALTYHQVHADDTWKSLALELLGAEYRHILLAQMNGHQPWIKPELGQLIVIPYNLAWLASGQESLATLAYRFLGSTKYAYRLVQYNNLNDSKLKRGQFLLMPLSELNLSTEGQQACERAAGQMVQQAQGDQFEKQKRSKIQLKELAQEARSGRYVSTVHLGTRLLAAGKLSQPEQARTHLLLLEAYVALDARGLARSTCEAYRSLEPNIDLDALTTSPKILKICKNRPTSLNKDETNAPPNK